MSANSMKLGRNTLCLMFMSLACLKAFGQNGEVKKEWTFQSSHGELLISASSFPSQSGGRFTSLGLGPNPIAYGSWTAAEEATSLSSVLDSLPRAGFDMQSLSFIQFRLVEKDALERVAVQAALSKTWRAALKARSGKSYQLVQEFINHSGAYKEWNRVFEQRGLQLKAVGIEKLGLEPFSKSGAICPPGVKCAGLLVPNDAFVQMNIIPLARSNSPPH